MRVLLAPALALLLGAAPIAVSADDVPAPIAATLEQNSNVRFGPTTSARIIVLLKAGEPIEVFGVSKTSPEWYVIRFPKQGKVWVHSKNLKMIDAGARYIITEDKTRARLDATIGAEVVAELNKGEIVEDKGLVVGDWRAVYIPDAVAYVAKKLVKMPADADKAMADRDLAAKEAEAAWGQAIATYTQFLEQVKANPKAAIGLDWAGLAAQLDVVIAKHASASTRNAAKRVRDSIAALVPTAIAAAPGLNLQPPAPIKPADQADPFKPVEPVKPADPATGTPVKPVDSGPRPLTPEEVEIMNKAKPKPSKWQAEGILVEDDQYQAKVGTRTVLMDGDGNVRAFIKTKDGVDLKLSELVYREVGALGEVQQIEPAQSGLPKQVKLIIASEVAPLR